jgi:4-diphosphocytidyl-2-C-methyl-D-erythritol kinase
LILFPNCKINLGLRVTAKRPDGYHDLETVFYPIPLRDAAEITTSHLPLHTSRVGENDDFELTVTGTEIPGDISSNLCTKAWQLIKKDFPDIPGVRMHLHKAIPVGGGLGGGSSDAAFTLVLLNEELKLNLTTEQLLSYALQLGSDCPFFIINKPCYATGRGEIMEEISIDLSGYHFVIANPGIHVSTAEAFTDIVISSDEKPSLKKIIAQPVSEWKGSLVNQFEESVFKKHPELKEIKDKLYRSGAVYASMTGTGSSIYGIFHNSKKTANLLAGEKFRVHILNQSH